MSDADEVIELSEEERRIIDAIYERRLTSTHYEILGVARGADRKVIRDAYFALSKRFHPDIFFKRSLGSYRARIDELFRVFTRAYDVLGNAKQRSGYDLHIASIESPSRPPPAAVTEVTDIVAAARAAAHAPSEMPRMATPASTPPAHPSSPPRVSAPPPRISSPMQPAVVNLPPPGRTPPRPVLPPIGTAVVPHAPAHAPAATPTAGAGATKVTPAAMQPLDPDTLRRARESMARRLNSAVPSRPQMPAPAAARPVTASQGQIPKVERAPTASQLVANAEELQKKSDFVGATELLKKALDLNKDDEAVRLRYEATRKLMVTQQVDQHITLARDAMREGQALAAVKHWEQAAEGRPSDLNLLLNAAEILAKYTRELKRATDLAQRVTVADPNNVKAHALLAQVFIRGGLKASAYASIQTIARINPEFPGLKDLREKLGPYTLAEKVGLRGR